ncbi:MAG: hypothetical protein MK008_04180 [Bdellovibrionales bacterium]|nr:hypothetical protein [Bdellovibrionales bacterium]
MLKIVHANMHKFINSIRVIVVEFFYNTRYKAFMGIRVLASFLLLISIQVQAQSMCVGLFSSSIYNVKTTSWNQSLYLKTLSQVHESQKIPSSKEFGQIEVQLGFIQALVNRSGLQGQVHLQQLPKKFQFKKQVSEYKAQKLIENLVSLQKEKMFFIKRWFTVHRKEVSEKHIDNYLKQQLLLSEFLSLLKSNELYKPNSKFEKVLQYINDNQSYRKLLTSVLVNYFSIQWFGFPMYLPEFQFLHQKKLTSSEISNLKSLSHKQRLESIRQRHSGRVKLDRILNFPRDAFPAFMTLTLLYYAFNPIVYIPEYITKSTNSELYQAWMEIYKKENGHYPNVFFNSSDRNEWAGLYKNIVDQYSTH